MLTKTSSSVQGNTFWHGDVLWRNKFESTLARVMTCCLRYQAITWTNDDISSVSLVDSAEDNLVSLPKPMMHTLRGTMLMEHYACTSRYKQSKQHRCHNAYIKLIEDEITGCILLTLNLTCAETGTFGDNCFNIIASVAPGRRVVRPLLTMVFDDVDKRVFVFLEEGFQHYNDVIMGAMAS